MPALEPVSITRFEDLMIVGANGGGWVAPVGTATAGSATPADPWAPLGAISDDGLVYGFDESKQDFTPWGLTTPSRTVITSSIRTFQIALWETARLTVKSIMYRVDVSTLDPDVDGNITFAESASPTPDRRAWLFDVYDGNTAERFYVPQGEVSARDNVTFKNDTMSAYSITISAYPDTDNNSVYHVCSVPIDAGS